MESSFLIYPTQPKNFNFQILDSPMHQKTPPGSLPSTNIRSGTMTTMIKEILQSEEIPNYIIYYTPIHCRTNTITNFPFLAWEFASWTITTILFNQPNHILTKISLPITDTNLQGFSLKPIGLGETRSIIIFIKHIIHPLITAVSQETFELE